MMQERVTLPSIGGSGAGGSGGAAALRDAAVFPFDFFGPDGAVCWLFAPLTGRAEGMMGWKLAVVCFGEG